ncbi:MAG: hypothetical protein E6H93_10440 [Chloroflexi bacterium]|nr:MAG: hypothetical protein E6H93_10440 [Chloroflexota bacterium]
MVGPLYLEHLSDADLRMLAAATELDDAARRDPGRIEAMIDSPAVFRRLFGTPGRDPLLQGSPFLLFAVLVHRAVRDLGQASFVEEWVGPRQRVPVFDVGGLRDFGADPMHRFFLAELLASYTHVASGSVLVQTRRGWRRRHFSELDPLRLIELAELLPVAERASVYRRLGDLSLFLTGVFPDYAAERLVVERERRRLERALATADRSATERRDGIWLLESLGRRAYRIAQQAADRRSAMAGVLAEVSQNFAVARRVLNFMTDRYLFPLRRQWFAAG